MSRMGGRGRTEKCNSCNTYFDSFSFLGVQVDTNISPPCEMDNEMPPIFDLNLPDLPQEDDKDENRPSFFLSLGFGI